MAQRGVWLCSLLCSGLHPFWDAVAPGLETPVKLFHHGILNLVSGIHLCFQNWVATLQTCFGSLFTKTQQLQLSAHPPPLRRARPTWVGSQGRCCVTGPLALLAEQEVDTGFV